MKKGVIRIIIGAILIISLIAIVSSVTEDKIEAKIYTALEKNDEAKVIVEIKTPDAEKGFIIKTNKTDEEILQEKENIKEEIKEEVGEENLRHEFDSHISFEVNSEELEKLKNNPHIESIEMVRRAQIFLQTSVPLVNSTKTSKLQLNNINLTGRGQTVCVLDTGINFSHMDLTEKNRTACTIDCIASVGKGGNCIENCSKMDDNGHGTHVGGIISASPGIYGVGIDIGLISVKVMNAAGQGDFDDVDAGIKWCISNSRTYNISVITMSLGADCDIYPQYCYNTYCDSDWASTANEIDNATLNNISVIIATGNDYNTNYISAPSCIQNATAVSSTNKDDSVSSYSNRNSLVDLFAPGSSINSTRWSTTACKAGGTCSGAYMILSGTSMATPHVAAAFAIINQMQNIQNNRSMTPFEIQSILNLTGKRINDSSGTGLNFSRINIYAAALYSDSVSPDVNLSYPTNNEINQSRNYSFFCNYSDWQISNVTLDIWNSSSDLIYNETHNATGLAGYSNFSKSGLSLGEYEWNCLASDLRGNFAYSQSNYSLTIGGLNTNLTSPVSPTYKKINYSEFNCSMLCEDGIGLSNVTFYLWNLSSYLIYNFTNNVLGVTNSSVFNYTFSSEGNYSWNCLATNNLSESSWASNNNSIVYDSTSPILNSTGTLVTSSTAAVSISTNEYCNSSINYGPDENLGTIFSSGTFLMTDTYSLTVLNSSTKYYYNLSYCDHAGNCFTNGTFSFTTSAAETVSSSGGGGGGGGSATPTPTVYEVKPEEINNGITKPLKAEEKISFKDSKNSAHTITLNSVKKSWVNITIMSSPINLVLSLGQEIKLNLTSKEYYDLYVKLVSINDNFANITIKKINESIINYNSSYIEIVDTHFESESKVSNTETPKKSSVYPKVMIGYFVLTIFIIMIMFVITVLLISRRKSGDATKEESKDKSTKKKTNY